MIKQIKSESCVGSEKLESLLVEVPFFSEVALEAQKIMSQAELDISMLVKVLETDPGLVGKILRIANSSFYGLERQIASLRDACIVLGQTTLRNIILTAAVMDVVHSQRIDRAAYNEMMQHFIHTGMLARDLATRVGVNGDTAYIVGLLHDIGSLFIEVLLPDEAEEIRNLMLQNSNELEEIEREVLGFSHAEFSGEIARHWKLPEEISEPLCSHHHAGEQVSKLNAVIYAADKISMLKLLREDSFDVSFTINESVLKCLGFNEQSILDYIKESVTPEEASLPLSLG